MTVPPLLLSEWSAVWVGPRYSIQLLAELQGAGSGREAVLVQLLLPLACSITLGLSTINVLYF